MARMANRQDPRKDRGPLAWAAQNPVFANLVMGLLLVGGLLFALDIQQTVFPDIQPNQVTVTVPYPSAAPEEVEEGVILAIEQEIRGIEGIERIRSTAAEGRGLVVAELFTGTDRDRARTDIEAAVSRIVTFPEDTEEPIVQVPDPQVQVLSLIVAGEVPVLTLRQLGEAFRNELLRHDNISLVELSGIQVPVMSIGVSQENLRRYGLTLGEIAGRITRTSVDLPAGEIDGASGDIRLRITEERETVEEFAAIPIISLPDGSRVRLGDIATIEEDFRLDEQAAYLNGTPAIRLDVFRVGKQTPIEVSAAAHEFVERQRKLLPDSIQLMTWDDSADIYADRMGLLVRNGSLGLALVLLVLGLFLMPQLAFWVTVGMAVSFLGAFLFMPIFDVSLNMISLFAFLLALGIVVDDAIVVGEASYRHRSMGLEPLDAAIAGAREMATPVTFAVFTTVIAFSPMLFVPGTAGDFFRNIPLIVIPILLLSLFESFFVLPAHIGHARQGRSNRLTRFQKRFAEGLERFIGNRYLPFARRAVELRYLTLALGLALLMVAGALVTSGRISFTFMPDIEGDIVTASLEFPFGTPSSRTREAIERLVSAAQAVDEELDGQSRGVFAQLGQLGGEDPTGAGSTEAGSHLAYVQVALAAAGEREFDSGTFANRWRERVGEIPGVRTLDFNTDVGPTTGDPISVELSHRDIDVLENAARELANELEGFQGVFEVDDGVELGKEQLSLSLSPAGYAEGLTPRDLAQIRAAYFGAEAERQQRGRHELRIYVRYPEAARSTEHSLRNFLVRLPEGGEMPLDQAAILELGRSPTSITRTDGRRTLRVTADVDLQTTTANEVVAELQQNALPQLIREIPGLDYRLAGEQQDQADALQSLGRGMLLALFAMYALMAVAFRSYIEPLLVMFAIPFGIVGAILGHLVMGFNLSLISLLGLVALAGVVVNDTLVYIIAVNKLRREGLSATDAVVEGGGRRFRPILLTSLTTFFGLAPMIFETSLQARFLIPMAISLGFGVLFVTVIVLILVPASYRIVEDGRQGLRRLRRIEPETERGRRTKP